MSCQLPIQVIQIPWFLYTWDLVYQLHVTQLSVESREYTLAACSNGQPTYTCTGKEYHTWWGVQSSPGCCHHFNIYYSCIIDMQSVDIPFVYRLGFPNVQERQENYGAVNCIYSSKRDVCVWWWSLCKRGQYTVFEMWIQGGVILFPLLILLGCITFCVFGYIKPTVMQLKQRLWKMTAWRNPSPSSPSPLWGFYNKRQEKVWDGKEYHVPRKGRMKITRELRQKNVMLEIEKLNKYYKNIPTNTVLMQE